MQWYTNNCRKFATRHTLWTWSTGSSTLRRCSKFATKATLIGRQCLRILQSGGNACLQRSFRVRKSMTTSKSSTTRQSSWGKTRWDWTFGRFKKMQTRGYVPELLLSRRITSRAQVCCSSSLRGRIRSELEPSRSTSSVARFFIGDKTTAKVRISTVHPLMSVKSAARLSLEFQLPTICPSKRRQNC